MLVESTITNGCECRIYAFILQLLMKFTLKFKNVRKRKNVRSYHNHQFFFENKILRQVINFYHKTTVGYL